MRSDSLRNEILFRVEEDREEKVVLMSEIEIMRSR